MGGQERESALEQLALPGRPMLGMVANHSRRDLVLALASGIGLLALQVTVREDGQPLALVMDLLAATAGGGVRVVAARGGVAIGVLLLGWAVLPAGWETVGEFAAVVPLIALTSQSFVAMVVGAAGVYYALLLAGIVRDAPGISQLLLSSAVWLAAEVLALLAGGAFAAAAREGAYARERALENQRRELAQDLHDTVAHDLTMIHLRTEECERRGASTPADLTAFEDLSERGLTTMRALITFLQPDSTAQATAWTIPSLEHILDDSAERLRRAGFTDDRQIEGPLDAIPPASLWVFAKVATEAVNDICKHGRPGPCAIMIGVTPDRLGSTQCSSTN